jgi:hypothetical protein
MFSNYDQAEAMKTDMARRTRNKLAAFCHFTWVASKNQLLVLDLQGKAGCLTDPEIVTVVGSQSYYGDGNVGLPSIQQFFRMHQCNMFCHKLDIGGYENRPEQSFYTDSVEDDSKASKAVSREDESEDGEDEPEGEGDTEEDDDNDDNLEMPQVELYNIADNWVTNHT